MQADQDTDIDNQSGLHRSLNWQQAFWLASGVSALVLFSVGGIAATVGTPSWLIWIVSVSFGFIQAFTYAEIAGLYPNKSGGVAVYGALAWRPYAKIVAPISVWCCWLAWTSVLAIGSGLAAGYLLSSFFAADALINNWEIELLSLEFINDGLKLRLNATFFIGAFLLLCVFLIQYRGIANAAKVQMIMGLAVIIPLLVVGIAPFIHGDVVVTNLLPMIPINGDWNIEGWTLVLGGMFIAAWSAYAFETAVCYTGEFKNPKRDTPRAILASGLLCAVIFSLVPLAFQGTLGVQAMLGDGIVDGSAIGGVMAQMVGGGQFVFVLMVVVLVLALLMAIMTSMAGSARTTYQGSIEGWLPKYLSKTNKHGAPTNAMWTDFGFNIVLLMMNDYLFILAVSNCCYMVFNFLNLNAGWIHRIDQAEIPRPWKAPSLLIAAGGFLAYVNMVLLGAGANVWGEGTLRLATFAIALVIPIYLYRHYAVDQHHLIKNDSSSASRNQARKRRAGVKPYIALAAGIAIVIGANWYFQI